MRLLIKKKAENLGGSILFLIFAAKNNNIRSYRLDRDTHQIKTKTEIASLVNGGPHLRVAEKPVDYKDGELSNLIKLGVFITSSIRPFIFYNYVFRNN
jgi:hypothetical protein